MQLNKNGKQTRWGSLVETLLNTATGFVVSMLVWSYIVAPAFNYNTTHEESFWITIIFKITSIIRSFIFRRLFEGLIKEQCV